MTKLRHIASCLVFQSSQVNIMRPIQSPQVTEVKTNSKSTSNCSEDHFKSPQVTRVESNSESLSKLLKNSCKLTRNKV